MMLLKHRINFLKKRPRVVKKKTAISIKCNTRQLPLEIQEIICFMVLGEDNSSSFALTAMRVCKTWASLVCERMYRQYQFQNYLQFIGFVNTISLENPILPYNLYVKDIDLAPVNKYGVDVRVRKLIKYCPNIVTITLGHITSVKADTLQLMARYCRTVHTLQMGGIQSFPFMFDCDFSGMTGLRNLSLTTTPLQTSSLQSLPTSIRHLQLVQMDSIQLAELSDFLGRHSKLITLSIRRCKHITNNFAQLMAQLPLLKELEVYGPEINDSALRGLFDIPAVLHTLRICHTQITDSTLDALTNGRLVIHHLNISNNANVTKIGIEQLLRTKQLKLIA
ncbi:uncharacterized protein EV154DRAFT_555480 [Mucor mucedo]|uniref:uncharacterized protein n=1 Tax=Mucor mucedo TaxID=29922 RepID=UPI00221EDDBA|nr:uncharacterized protein EV154DRAFT_555480 [Mucor mucedo]KAI7878359.1 hypothetical protein EV154DRAFT_555480 [Mucor mucedo]